MGEKGRIEKKKTKKTNKKQKTNKQTRERNVNQSQYIFVWILPREQEICLSLPILLRTIRLALHEDASGIATAERVMNNLFFNMSICII